MVKYHHPYLVKQSGIVKLVQGWPMSSLDAHNVPVIVQSRQRLPGQVPEGLFRLLLAKQIGAALETIHAIHVESRSSQGIQFHRLGISIPAYPVLVSHSSSYALLFFYSLAIPLLFLGVRYSAQLGSGYQR